ncbi:MAG: type II secretion system F family protein [Pseudomonadota bacterium]|jgi:tight adherence protein B|nr:pilus assembly protein [Alphaproteobacteria bacterium]
MGANTLILLTALMAALSAAGIGYAVFGQRISQADRMRSRIQSVGGRGPADGRGRDDARGKGGKRNLQAALKELEDAQKGKKKQLSLRQRFEQAGVDWTEQNFYIGSAAAGVIAFLAVLLSGYGIVIGALAGLGAGLGGPRWLLNYLARKRQTAFGELFVNAVDVVVRGVKAGLPIGECMAIIGRESPDPLGKEFRTLIEGQKLGIPLSQGLERMLERMPSAELNFFYIVITIQGQSGGNLSEALGNLSSVLRARKLMRAKIQSMSSEAKASAMIIGSLPFIVSFMLYFVSPEHLNLLFTTTMGNIMVAGGLIVMSIGALIMRNMINFDF